MFDVPLADLQTLDPSQKTILSNASLLSPAEVLLPSLQALTTTLQPLPPQQVAAIVQAVALGVCPSPVKLGKAREPSTGSIPFGDPVLDALLGGGVRIGQITELAGQSSAGKSQLCLTLALSAQFPFSSSPPGSVVYISSEGSLPSNRLLTLAEGLLARHPSLVESHGITLNSLFDNIHFIQCNDVEALDHTLSYLLPTLASRLSSTDPPTPHQLPLRLIILDSLTALTRSSFASSISGLAERSSSLSSIADKLKTVGFKWKLAVVVVNQVSDVFDFGQLWGFGSSDGPAPSSYYTFHPPPPTEKPDDDTAPTTPGKPFQLGYKAQTKWTNGSTPHLPKEASLGLVWTNSVNTRLMLSRTNRRCTLDDLPPDVQLLGGMSAEGEEGGRGGVLVRRIAVVFSPNAERTEQDFVVLPDGVAGLDSVSSEIGTSRKRPREETDGLKLEEDEDESFGDEDAVWNTVVGMTALSSFMEAS